MKDNSDRNILEQLELETLLVNVVRLFQARMATQ